MGILKRFAVVLGFSIGLTGPLWAPPISAPLNIAEEDDDPSTFPFKLKVTNGSLTDNGDGTVSLDTGGGGSGGGYDLEPATVTIQGDKGITASTMTVSSNTVLSGNATFYHNSYPVFGDSSGNDVPALTLTGGSINNTANTIFKLKEWASGGAGASSRILFENFEGNPFGRIEGSFSGTEDTIRILTDDGDDAPRSVAVFNHNSNRPTACIGSNCTAEVNKTLKVFSAFPIGTGQTLYVLQGQNQTGDAIHVVDYQGTEIWSVDTNGRMDSFGADFDDSVDISAGGLTVSAGGLVDTTPEGSTVTYHLTVGSMTVSDLSDGECVETTTGGRLTTTGSACSAGGGGGGSTLAVTTGTSSGFDTVISSPTDVLNLHGSQFIVELTGSATAYTRIDTSSITALGATIEASEISDQNAGTDITADLEEETHATEHENGGADEISVSGLSGELADPQTVEITTGTTVRFTEERIAFEGGTNVITTAQGHTSSGTVTIALNENAGTDISADLEEETHATEHEDGGADEVAVTGGMMNADFGDWTCDGTATGCSLDANTVDTNELADGTLVALSAYNTNGLVTQTSADTFTGRTITEADTSIDITNGDGVSGNPTIAVSTEVVKSTGTTFATGDILYHDGSVWKTLGIGSGGQVLEVSPSGIPEWDADDSGGGGGTTIWVEDNGSSFDTAVSTVSFNETGGFDPWVLTQNPAGQVDVEISTNVVAYLDNDQTFDSPVGSTFTYHVTMGSLTVTSSGTVRILSPDTASFLEFSLNNSTATMRYFQAGSFDHVLDISEGDWVWNGLLRIDEEITAGQVIRSREGFQSAPASASPNTTDPGIMNLWSNSAGSSYVSFNENTVANRGAIGFLGGSADFIIETGAQNLGSGTEQVRVSPSGGVTINSSATVAGSGGLSVTFGTTVSTLTVNNSLFMNSPEKTADYVMTSTDTVILASAPVSGAITITLPSASQTNQTVVITKIDESTNTVNVVGSGSEQIVSTGTVRLYAQGSILELVSNGSAWYPLSKIPAPMPYIGNPSDPNSAASSASNNNSHYISVYVSEPVTVYGVRLAIGASSGNMDVGLYSSKADGSGPDVRLASSGSTASPGTGAQTVNFTEQVNILPGSYYLAVAMDNTTLTVTRSGINPTIGCLVETTAFPLPASAGSVGPGGARCYSMVGLVRGGLAQ